jgi:hypothetical protein
MRTPPIGRRLNRSRACGPAESEAEQLKHLLHSIEAERANLSRAESLLSCLTIAMEYHGQALQGPYYPDVAEIAREMVRKSIQALDPINLHVPSRGKVRDSLRFGIHFQPAMPRQSENMRIAYSLPAPALGWLAIPRGIRLRLHRRAYSREPGPRSSEALLLSARYRSSRRSASENISGCVVR